MANPFESKGLKTGIPAALSREDDSREDLSTPEALSMPELDDSVRDGLSALYTDDFPLIEEQEPEDEDWWRWAEALWNRHAAPVQLRLHLVERNRLFYQGIQWIDAIGTSGWYSPPKPKDAARVVFNMVKPALDQRTEIIAEQRPGFKTRPASEDRDDIKKAEAHQIALEYQWDQQEMQSKMIEAAHRSGVDGVVFGEVYWDPDRGPWHEAFGFNEEDELQPIDLNGEPTEKPSRFRLGDVNCRFRRIEQVRVSANAAMNEAPIYWVMRDILPLAEAMHEYGLDLNDDELQQEHSNTNDQLGITPRIRLGFIQPDIDEPLVEQDTVERFTVYCEPSEFLPDGLHLVSVGKKTVFIGELQIGMAPIFPWRDGSPDPAFFPQSICEMWFDSQMRVNAVLSKWVENVRLNAGVKLIAKTNTVSTETLTGQTMTVIEAKGLGPLSDIIRPLEAFSLAPDAKELLALEVQNFENLSGWNDTSRGSFSPEQSGRAILAIREQLERIFAPPVGAAAKAMTKWAMLTLLFMRWGYDIPRTIAVQGKGRPDLAREFQSDDFDGVTDVWVDPETLMPMPRALKLHILDIMRDKQIIDNKTYLERQPFGFLREIQHRDFYHANRAYRTIEAMRRGQWLPVLPMDSEAVHMEILEKEVLLNDDESQEVRAMAFERWQQLQKQAQFKQMQAAMAATMIGGGRRPAAPPRQGKKPGRSQGSSPLSPLTQPLLGTNPSLSAGPVGGVSDQQQAARGFDRRSQR